MRRFKTRLAQLEQRQATRAERMTLRIVCHFPHSLPDVVLLETTMGDRLRPCGESTYISDEAWQAACEAWERADAAYKAREQEQCDILPDDLIG
jgi:hypothetical protein